VTTEGGAEFVAPEDRIATFDQDGSLWVEHPLYTQAMFALDRGRRAGAGAPGGWICPARWLGGTFEC
jgi:hypothetical protein